MARFQPVTLLIQRLPECDAQEKSREEQRQRLTFHDDAQKIYGSVAGLTRETSWDLIYGSLDEIRTLCLLGLQRPASSLPLPCASLSNASLT